MKHLFLCALLTACASGGGGTAAPHQSLSNEPPRWQHKAFYVRVARLVKSQWAPLDSFRQADPDGHKYGPSARNIVVEVALAPDGSVSGTRIAQSSGVDFLDATAESAVRAASPIPGAPADLFEGAAEARFQLAFRFEPAAARTEVSPL